MTHRRKKIVFGVKPDIVAAPQSWPPRIDDGLTIQYGARKQYLTVDEERLAEVFAAELKTLRGGVTSDFYGTLCLKRLAKAYATATFRVTGDGTRKTMFLSACGLTGVDL